MTWHPSRRDALGAALALGVGPLIGCSHDVTPSPPGPTPNGAAEDTAAPGDRATRDPLDKLLPGACLQLAPDGQVVAALGFGEVFFWETSGGSIASRTELQVDVFDAASTEPWSWAADVIALKGTRSSATANIVDSTTGALVAEVVVSSGAETVGPGNLP